MCAYSFTTQGSTPQFSFQKPSIIGKTGGSTTPVSKALNSAVNPSGSNGSLLKSPLSSSNFNIATGAPKPIDFSKVSLTNPSTPIKSVKGADGTVVEYHKPDIQKNASQVPSSGMLNPSGPTSTTSTTPKFPGIVGSLVDTTTQGSPTGQQAVQGLLDISKNNPATSGPGFDAYNQAVQRKQQFESNVADELAENRMNPIAARFKQGREGAIQSANLTKLGALQGAVQEAQAGIGFGIQGQQAQQAGFTSAAGAANTAQGQRQSGLTSAAGIGQPSPAAFGQTVFDPLTGQYSGGGGLPPEVMQQYAQMAAYGQISAIPESITSNPVLSAQLNAAAKALNPNFNPITSAAQGASASDLTSQASQIQANANGAEANFRLLLSTAQQGGVNNTNVPILNTLQNNLNRGLTSSEAVTLFRNTLSTVRNQYATILGGGQATDMSRGIAQEQIPDDISISALQALEQQLKSESQNRVVGLQQQIQSLSGNSGGGTSNNSSGSVGWF